MKGDVLFFLFFSNLSFYFIYFSICLELLIRPVQCAWSRIKIKMVTHLLKSDRPLLQFDRPSYQFSPPPVFSSFTSADLAIITLTLWNVVFEVSLLKTLNLKFHLFIYILVLIINYTSHLWFISIFSFIVLIFKTFVYFKYFKFIL